MEDVPIIDMKVFLERLQGWEKECEKVASSLHQYGILIVKDPRALEQENEEYIDLMERYFDKTSKAFYEGQ